MNKRFSNILTLIIPKLVRNPHQMENEQHFFWYIYTIVSKLTFCGFKIDI